MSLKNRKALFEQANVQVDHGAAALESIELNVSEDHSARLVTIIDGKDAGSTGNLELEVFGILGELETTLKFDSVTIAATGITQKVQAYLVDVRGFDKIKVKLTYTNGAGDYVTAQVWAGIPHASGVRTGT